MTLQEHLDACAPETGLRVGRAGPAFDELKAALATDAALRSEAATLIAASEAVELRDHVTRWRNTLLRQALGASP